MADSVQIGVSAGEVFTWTNATFNWNSATATKLWSASSRTQHDVAVAIALAITEQRRVVVRKPVAEAFLCSSAHGKSVLIRRAEGLHIAQSYADFIAFVLRFVEALALVEQRHHQVSKALVDAWQAVDGLSNAGIKSVVESVHTLEASRREAHLVQLETLSIAQSYADIIAFVLRFVELIGVDDAHVVDALKRLSIDLGLEEHLANDSSKLLFSSFDTSDGARWEFFAAVLEIFGLAYGFGRGLDLPLKERFGIGSAPHREWVTTCLEALGVEGALARKAQQRVQELLQVAPNLSQAQIKPIVEFFDVFELAARDARKCSDESFGLAELANRDIWRVIVQALAASDAPGLQASKALAESLTTMDQSRVEMVKRVAESLSLLETYTDLIAFIVSVSEALRMDERAANVVIKPIDESLDVGDVAHREVTKDVHVVLNVLDALNKDLRHALDELLSVDGALANSTVKALADALTTTDDLRRDSVVSWTTAIGIDVLLGRQGSKALQDAVSLASNLGRNTNKVVVEQFFANDVLVGDVTKALHEAVAFIDAYADLIAWLLDIQESVTVARTSGRTTDKQLSESFAAKGQWAGSSVKSFAESIALAEATGRTVAFRRFLNEGLAFGEAISRAQALSIRESLELAEQYRRHANGVISDMILSSAEITEQDFMDVVEAGHAPGYTDFRDFIAGDYTYARAMFRAVLKSKNADRGYIKGLRLSVDVPDVVDRGTATITNAINGVAISFVRSFRVPPEVTLTHKGGAVLAIARLAGSATTTGFTAVLEDATGQCVTGTFSWIAQGY